jgi:hypothetical protein
MKKQAYLLLMFSCSIIIICSCVRKKIDNKKPATVINVGISNDPIKTSSLFSDPQLVILQRGEFPLGNISKLKVYRDTIYILSNLKIFIYDKYGSFINVINKSGRGPGEYINTYDFTVDENGRIDVLDFRGKKILKYDRKGNYLDDWKIGMYGFSLTKSEANYVIFGGNSNKATDYSEKMVYVFNKWKGHIIREFITVDKNMSRYLNYVDLRNIQSTDQGFYLGFSPYDTIYYYEGDLLPRYLIDFGRRKISHQLFSRNFDDILAFDTYLNDKDLCHLIYNYLVSPPLIMFNFLYKNDYWLGAYLPASGEVFSSNVIEDDLLLKGNKYQTQSFFPMEFNNGVYYFMLQPYQVTNYIKDNGVQNIGKIDLDLDSLLTLKIEDNPILLTFKIKR